MIRFAKYANNHSTNKRAWIDYLIGQHENRVATNDLIFNEADWLFCIIQPRTPKHSQQVGFVGRCIGPYLGEEQPWELTWKRDYVHDGSGDSYKLMDTHVFRGWLNHYSSTYIALPKQFSGNQAAPKILESSDIGKAIMQVAVNHMSR